MPPKSKTREPVRTPRSRSRSHRATSNWSGKTIRKKQMSAPKQNVVEIKEHKRVPPPSDVVAIPVHTLNRSQCLREGTVSMVLGRGTYGQVFDFCDVKDRQTQSCKYVLKLQTLQGVAKPNHCFGPVDRYMQEVFYHLYVQTHSLTPITPKLLDHWVCTDPSISDPQSIGIGCILMERWDGSLNNRILGMEELAVFITQAEIWTRELVRLKLDHRDVFRRNILFRGSGSKIEFALSDWGMTTIDMDAARLEQTYDMAFGAIMASSQKELERERTQTLINLI